MNCVFGFSFSAAVSAVFLVGSTVVAETSDDASSKFAALEARTKSRIGIAGVDVSTKRRVEYRGDERFLMCSTFKVLAVAAALKRVDERKEKLDRFVPYGEAQLLAYAPLRKALPKSSRPPSRTLV